MERGTRRVQRQLGNLARRPLCLRQFSRGVVVVDDGGGIRRTVDGPQGRSVNQIPISSGPPLGAILTVGSNCLAEVYEPNHKRNLTGPGRQLPPDDDLKTLLNLLYTYIGI